MSGLDEPIQLYFLNLTPHPLAQNQGQSRTGSWNGTHDQQPDPTQYVAFRSRLQQRSHDTMTFASRLRKRGWGAL